MTGLEQAAFWLVFFAVVFPSYHYVKRKITNYAASKPRQDEQDPSDGTF